MIGGFENIISESFALSSEIVNFPPSSGDGRTDDAKVRSQSLEITAQMYVDEINSLSLMDMLNNVDDKIACEYNNYFSDVQLRSATVDSDEATATMNLNFVGGEIQHLRDYIYNNMSDELKQSLVCWYCPVMQGMKNGDKVLKDLSGNEQDIALYNFNGDYINEDGDLIFRHEKRNYAMGTMNGALPTDGTTCFLDIDYDVNNETWNQVFAVGNTSTQKSATSYCFLQYINDGGGVGRLRFNSCRNNGFAYNTINEKTQNDVFVMTINHANNKYMLADSGWVTQSSLTIKPYDEIWLGGTNNRRWSDMTFRQFIMFNRKLTAEEIAFVKIHVFNIKLMRILRYMPASMKNAMWAWYCPRHQFLRNYDIKDKVNLINLAGDQNYNLQLINMNGTTASGVTEERELLFDKVDDYAVGNRPRLSDYTIITDADCVKFANEFKGCYIISADYPYDLPGRPFYFVYTEQNYTTARDAYFSHSFGAGFNSNAIVKEGVNVFRRNDINNVPSKSGDAVDDKDAVLCLADLRRGRRLFSSIKYRNIICFTRSLSDAEVDWVKKRML